MPAPKNPEALSSKIWFDGELIDWKDAKVHVLTHALHYGSSVFEGIRCYETHDGPAIFRLRDHIDRLMYSAKVMRMKISFSTETIHQACIDAVAVNGLPACYIRPLAFRGVGGLGLLPADNPAHVTVIAWPWGAYLGDEGLSQGIDVAVSSYAKVAPNTFPALAKIGGGYVMASLAKMEAKRHGYAEALLLDTTGRVAEGTGENLFAVRNGTLITPPLSHSILGGITRRSIIRLAEKRGHRVVEQALSREMLHLCDELFLTGTAAEVTPVRSVDGLPVGVGKPGPITKELQDDFFAIVRGDVPDSEGWLTQVGTWAAVTEDL